MTPRSPSGLGLLDKRVLFVFGKGGVGKTTVAATLGLLSAARGRETILAEMNGAESMAALFGREPVGYRPGRIRPYLSGLSITPARAVEEYLVRMLRFRLLYETVFRNRFIAPLMDGVLGLSDLISVGKVMDLEWERRDGTVGPDAQGPPRWDFVVVDGPATGHGLSMLRSAGAIMALAKMGPLYQNAREIRNLLADRLRFGVVLVTLPEELPVTETIEAVAALREDVDTEVCGVVVNQVPPPLFRNEREAARWPRIREQAVLLGGRAERAVDDGEKALAERARAEQQIRRLREATGLPAIELPRLDQRDLTPVCIEELARAVEEAP